MNHLIDRRYGDFELRNLLGKGNTGTVYHALRVSTEEAVAVKILHPELLTDPGARKRFASEVEVAARFIHPGVVPIYDFGEANGAVFVAMELLREGTAFPPAGREPFQQDMLRSRIELLRQVAEILADAHARHVLHLDLHPGNILWNRSGRGSFQVKLLDFGLLRAVHEGISTGGELRGDPGYLAPEQWHGAEADEKTDLYSFGVLLYQVSTGTMPFPPSAPATAMYSHLYVDAPPPRRIRPELSPLLESTILRCLAKKPRDRTASAREVSETLRAVLSESEEQPSAKTFARAAGAGVLEPSFPQAAKLRPEPPPETSSSLSELKDEPGVPKFQVVDERGVVVSRGRLLSSGATIGTAADNLIILNSGDISPHHARIDWDGVRITITDLGSRTSTFLNDQRLLPQIAQEWTSDQQVRIGSHWIRVTKGIPDIITAKVIDIVVEHSKRTMTLTPGKAEECRVTIANHKTIVDHITLSVIGIDAEWVHGTGVEIALNPYDRKDVLLSILVPKLPTSTAGPRDVVLRAESLANPNEPADAKVQWTIAPFDGATLATSPSKVSARRRGSYTVSINNEGNRPASYYLTATDEDRELAFEFEAEGAIPQSRPKVSIAPGAKAALRLTADAPKRRWVGNALRRTFQIHAIQHGGEESHVLEAKFIHLPLISTWMIAAGSLLIAGLLLVVPRLERPVIRNIEFEPHAPHVGEAVTILWNAARAKTVEVRPLKAGINAKQGSYTVSGGFDKETVLTLIASNFFGSDQREISVTPVAPTVLPPSSVAISVSKAVIPKNSGVTISWNVIGGTSAEFSLTGSVPLQGSYTDYPDKDQVYTITGYNAANVPTKKSITVRVTEPIPPLSPKPHLTVDKNLIHQGQFVLLTWAAKGAKDVRIDSLSPTTLTGSAGQKQAKLKGKGRYTFTVVSTNEAGQESKSDPIVVDVDCTFMQKMVKTCSDTPQIEWR